MMNSEIDCTFVSSRGILKSCDIHSATPISSVSSLINYKWDNLKPGSTVYICTSAIGQWSSFIDQISCPIILVSGDADGDTPTSIFGSEEAFRKFIESPNIIHWFAQNVVLSHPKLSRIPIGLYYHAIPVSDREWVYPKISPVEQEKVFKGIIRDSMPLSRRLVKAHANFHFQMWAKYSADRVRAQELIPADLVDYEPRRVDRETTWRNQSHYAFVISPHGNGLDCHRTWEALCLGCIPIVKTSPIDGLYDNLPVYIVNDWNEVTEGNLKRVFKDFSRRKFDRNRLTLKYWMHQINSKKIS